MSECGQCPVNKISAEGAGLCTGCPQRSLPNIDRTKCGMDALCSIVDLNLLSKQ